MTLQKQFTPKQQLDYAFRQEYSLHKIWIALENGDTKTHYARDCNATILQISCGRVSEITLSSFAGLEDCLAKEKFFRGRYTTVEIWRRSFRGQWQRLHKYISGNLVEESTDKPPADLHCKIESTRSGGFKLVPIS